MVAFLKKQVALLSLLYKTYYITSFELSQYGLVGS